jgi:hypothetical protein
MRGGWRTAGARRARFLPRRPHAILPPPPPVVYHNVRFVFDGQRIQETTTPDDVRRGGWGLGRVAERASPRAPSRARPPPFPHSPAGARVGRPDRRHGGAAGRGGGGVREGGGETRARCPAAARALQPIAPPLSKSRQCVTSDLKRAGAGRRLKAAAARAKESKIPATAPEIDEDARSVADSARSSRRSSRREGETAEEREARHQRRRERRAKASV